MKDKFKRMKCVHEEMMSSYLDEFMWCEKDVDILRQQYSRARYFIFDTTEHRYFYFFKIFVDW